MAPAPGAAPTTSAASMIFLNISKPFFVSLSLPPSFSLPRRSLLCGEVNWGEGAARVVVSHQALARKGIRSRRKHANDMRYIVHHVGRQAGR